MIKFIHGMKKYFGITHGVNDFLDPMMTEITLKPSLDIFALDDWLDERFDDYDKEGNNKSMEDIIREKFGEEAVVFVQANL